VVKIVVRERPRLGLADEVRAHFPNAVDVVIDDPTADIEPAATAPSLQGRSPHDLFAEYLIGRAETDPRLLALFDRLLDEAST